MMADTKHVPWGPGRNVEIFRQLKNIFPFSFGRNYLSLLI
jgi:hypothetical protein